MLNIHFEAPAHSDYNAVAIQQAKGIVAAMVAMYGPEVLPAGVTSVKHEGPKASVVPLGTTIPVVSPVPPKPEPVTAVVPPPPPPGVPDEEPYTPPAFITGGAVAAFAAQAEVDAKAAFGAATTEILGTAETAAADTTTQTFYGEPPEYDSAGVPWDARIHASTRTKVAAGTWTRRRNTDDEVYKAVLAELMNTNVAPPPAPPSTGAVTPPPPPPPPSEGTQLTGPSVSFGDVVLKVTGAQMTAKLLGPELHQLLGQFGAKTVVDLKDNQPAIDAFNMALDAVLQTKG